VRSDRPPIPETVETGGTDILSSDVPLGRPAGLAGGVDAVGLLAGGTACRSPLRPWRPTTAAPSALQLMRAHRDLSSSVAYRCSGRTSPDIPGRFNALLTGQRTPNLRRVDVDDDLLGRCCVGPRLNMPGSNLAAKSVGSQGQGKLVEGDVDPIVHW
jgi:hypothetical protein